MSFKPAWRIIAAATIALSATAALAAPPSLGKNLIKNPGADATAGAGDTTTVVAPENWTTTGNATAIKYGIPFMPSLDSPGPPKRRDNLFAGGPNSAVSSMTQRINVKALAEPINTGTIGYSLIGYLGGSDVQNDNTTVDLVFADPEQVELGRTSLPAVLAADRGNVSGTLKRKATGPVPINTRYIIVTVNFNRVTGAYNNAYADALSLVLKEVAAP